MRQYVMSLIFFLHGYEYHLVLKTTQTNEKMFEARHSATLLQAPEVQAAYWISDCILVIGLDVLCHRLFTLRFARHS